MPKPLDDVLKIRCTSEDKALYERAAEADPDAADLSKWARRELTLDARIQLRQSEAGE